MTSIPSDPGHPMRGFTEIDNTADEPGIPRFPNLTPVDDPSLPQPAAARATAPVAPAAADDGDATEGGGADGANGGGDEDTAVDE